MFHGPFRTRVEDEHMLAEIPNGPGDVWSILIAAIAFVVLFLFLRLLEGV